MSSYYPGIKELVVDSLLHVGFVKSPISAPACAVHLSASQSRQAGADRSCCCHPHCSVQSNTSHSSGIALLELEVFYFAFSKFYKCI